MFKKIALTLTLILLVLTCYAQIDQLLVPQYMRLPALLSCGKREKNNENYFAALDKIAGINKENFNTTIEKLVEDEQVK